MRFSSFERSWVCVCVCLIFTRIKIMYNILFYFLGDAFGQQRYYFIDRRVVADIYLLNIFFPPLLLLFRIGRRDNFFFFFLTKTSKLPYSGALARWNTNEKNLLVHARSRLRTHRWTQPHAQTSKCNINSTMCACVEERNHHGNHSITRSSVCVCVDKWQIKYV